MSEMIYVLMLLSPVLGWHIAAVEGNPYPTFKACSIVRHVIKLRKVTVIDGNYFSDARCVPTPKNTDDQTTNERKQ